MSTTFGVKIKEEVIQVARRVSGKIFFATLLAELLPDSTPVIPMDNSAQGIYQIGHIKRAIKDGDICPDDTTETDYK